MSRSTIYDITERRKLEAKLKQAAAYTRSLIEASVDPLVTISAGGKITDVNEATIKVTGVSAEKLIGTDFADYFTEPEKAREGYRQVFAQGSVTDYPLTIRHKDGTLTYVLYNASIYRDEAGAVVGVFAAARDITERKRAEEALRRTQDLLNETQRMSKIGGWECDLATGRTMWTDEVYRIHGVSKDSYDPNDPNNIARSIGFYAPQAQSRIREAFNRAVEHGDPYELELPFINARNEELWVRTSARAERRAGKVVRVFGNLMDITERKRVEEAVLRTARALDERVKELSCLYAVASLTQQRSRPLTAVLQGSLEALVAAYQYPEITCARITVDGQTQRTEPFQQTPWRQAETIPLNGTAGVIEVFYREERPPAQEGPFLVEERVMLGAVAELVSRSLRERQEWTARVQAEEAQQRLNRELEQTLSELRTTQRQMIQSEKLAAIGTLAAGVAHELNNPLTGLLTFIQYAIDKTADREQVNVVLQDADKAAQRMVRMVRIVHNLLAVASGQLRVGRPETPTTVALALERVVSLLGYRILKEGIVLRSALPDDLPAVAMGSDPLQQVLLNLLTNALDAVEGTAQKRVEVTAEARAGAVEISVSDSGCGIPEALQGRIMDPFFTTKEVGRGSGLGLWIVTNLLNEYGGSIRFWSREGEGARFTVSLPASVPTGVMEAP